LADYLSRLPLRDGSQVAHEARAARLLKSN